MAGELAFLTDLAIITGIAAAASLLFQRMRLPLVFGLLVAGVIIGPNTPPFQLVSSIDTLQTLADLGVVLLLFGLGLEFELRLVRRVGGPALLITTVELLVMFWLGFEAALLLGWDRTDAIFVGAMLGISSTAIIVTTLRELGRLEEESSRILFAVLVLEDLAAVIVLVLLGGYAATGGLPLADAAGVLGRMLLFLVVLVLGGLLVIPRAMDAIANRFPPEVIVLTLLGLGLGAAAVSGLFDFHVGLGAFLMGTVLAEAKRRHEFMERLRPIHDLFTAIFFVSIGTLVDFRVLVDYAGPIALLCALLIVGKMLGGALPALLAGYAPGTALSVGAALAQVGEFSFVIAALGLSTGAMDPALFSVIVGAAAVTSFTSPLTIRYVDKVGAGLGKLVPNAVRTYVHSYAAWMREARSDERKPAAAVTRPRRDAILAGVLAATLLGAGFVLQPWSIGLLMSVGLSEDLALLAHWGLVAAFVVPAVWEVVRSVERWIDASRPPDAERTKGLRRAVRSTILVVTTIMFGLPLIAATAPFVDNTAVVVAWLLVVATLGLALAGQVRALHRRLTDTIEKVLHADRQESDTPEILERLYSGPFPLDVGTGTFTVEADSWVVGRTLAELGIRKATGATIIYVEGPDGLQQVATPSTMLRAGDRVALMGSEEQIEAARVALARARPEGGVHVGLQTGRIYVTPGSFLDGVTLRSAALRVRFGVQILALLRENQVVANPPADETLDGGDILLALGTGRDLLRLEETMHPPGPAPMSGLVDPAAGHSEPEQPGSVP